MTIGVRLSVAWRRRRRRSMGIAAERAGRRTRGGMAANNHNSEYVQVSWRPFRPLLWRFTSVQHRGLVFRRPLWPLLWRSAYVLHLLMSLAFSLSRWPGWAGSTLADKLRWYSTSPWSFHRCASRATAVGDLLVCSGKLGIFKLHIPLARAVSYTHLRAHET